MNYRSEQFKSRSQRKKEADLCAHYGKLQLPAVNAAKQVGCKDTVTRHKNYNAKAL